MDLLTFLLTLLQFRTAVVVRSYFLLQKVLLRLSSEIKSRKFECSMKMVAVAPHHRFVQPMLASYISFGVGCYCFIHTTGNARARFQDKANIVPTPYFLSAFFWELVGYK